MHHLDHIKTNNASKEYYLTDAIGLAQKSNMQIKAIKIEFISGINGSNILKRLVNSKKFDIAFKLCPTNISSVMKIADKKRFMPPKSTWFHPKPLDGLICSEL